MSNYSEMKTKTLAALNVQTQNIQKKDRSHRTANYQDTCTVVAGICPSSNECVCVYVCVSVRACVCVKLLIRQTNILQGKQCGAKHTFFSQLC